MDETQHWMEALPPTKPDAVWKELTIRASNEGLKEDGATTYWWAISTRSGCVAGSKSWGLSYNTLGAVFLSSGSGHTFQRQKSIREHSLYSST